MKKRLLSLLLCLAFVLTLAQISFSASAATTITSVAITNVPTPRPGGAIPVSATVSTAGAALYSLEWYDVTAGEFVYSGSDTFIENHVYRVDIWVEAKDGYTFACINDNTPNVSATVTGKTSTVSKAYEYKAWAMVVVSYTFPACVPKTVSAVSIELDGLVKSGNVLCATENGSIPFSFKSVTDGVTVYPELNTNRYYPYGFNWRNTTKSVTVYDGDRFKGGCEYYVTIAVKPVGYSFDDNLTATVNGVQATVKSKSATDAEIGISVTCFGSIYSGDIAPVAILPKAGNTPDYEVTYAAPQCNHIDYARVLGWYDVATGDKLYSNDTFQTGKKYRVEIELTAAYLYKFARDANDKMAYAPYITGHSVDSYSFGYDSYRGSETITVVKTFATESVACTHTPSAWRTTGAYHYKACTTCGDFLEQEDHYGGTATCSKKGKCTVCGYEYIEENENHTPDTSKWVARAEMYHYHPCALCGAHCDIEEHRWSPRQHSVGAQGHAYQCADCAGYDTVSPHTPGPEATDTEPQTCTDCGHIITPAKNHKHQITAVDANAPTCTRDGNIAYYMCTDCGAFFADKDGKVPLADSILLPAPGHTTADGWKYDKDSHWQICTTCKEVISGTKASHQDADGVCPVCSYTLGAEIPEETQATQPTQPEKTDNDPGNEPIDWWILVLIGLVCFGAAVTVVVILSKKKKGGN